MKITLKDGTIKEYGQAMSVYDIALDISEGLARNACAGEIDGGVVDLRTVVDRDCSLQILTARDTEGLRKVKSDEWIKTDYNKIKTAVSQDRKSVV